MLSGKQFKENKQRQFYKLVHSDIDLIGFHTVKKYEPKYACTDYVDAIYFGDTSNILSHYKLKRINHVRLVSIPDDAIISCVSDYFTYYTNKIIIGDKISMEKFVNENIYEIIEYSKKWINRMNKYLLKYVANQTEEMCLDVIKCNGLALKYVIDKTPKLCLEAVKQCGCRETNGRGVFMCCCTP